MRNLQLTWRQEQAARQSWFHELMESPRGSTSETARTLTAGLDHRPPGRHEFPHPRPTQRPKACEDVDPVW